MNRPMLAIVRTELRRRKMYMSLWGLGIVILTAFTVLAYGAVKTQADQLNKAFANLTTNAGSFFGTSDMFSPVGYLNSQLFYIVLPLLFIILGVTLTSSLTFKEERGHTLELLLARPISRAHLLLAKIIIAVSVFVVLGIATLVTIVVCDAIVGLAVSAGYVALATLLMTLFAGAFAAVAFALYTTSQKSGRAAAAVAILLSLGGYIVTSIAGLVDKLSWLAKIFPYHYYNPGDILRGHVASGLIIYIGCMFLVSLIISLVGFARRDIA